MEVSSGSINYDSATFKVYYLTALLLCLKMFFMVLLIGRQRFLKKSVISPEDTIFLKGLKVRHNDPDVERPRRAFMNDVENIFIYMAVGSIYCMLNPNPVVAIPLMITYTLTRYFHTFVYAVKVAKQPSRFLSYLVGALITVYMAASVIHSLKDAM